MFLVIANIIIIILEAYSCFLFFDVFHPKKKNEDRRGDRIIAIVSLSIFLFFISYYLQSSFLLRQIVGVAIIALTMFLARKYSLLQAFLIAFVFQGILTATEFLGLLIAKMVVVDINNMDEIEQISVMNIGLITLIVMLMCIILVRRFFRIHHNETVFRKEWIRFVLFPIFTNIVIILMTKAFGEVTALSQAYALYGIGIGLVIMNYYIFHLLDDTIRVHGDVKSDALFMMQKKDGIEMYSALYNSLERQKSESHDFRSHIMCLKNMADNNDIDNLKKYLGEIIKSGTVSENVIDTHNVIINAILNTKYYEAASKDIVMVMKLNDLSHVILQNDDLVVLLSNLLNNAIEATEKCDEKKIIYIKMEQEEDGLILSVKNPYNHVNMKKGDEYVSSKDNSLGNHGIGLKNIKKVVEKYNGVFAIQDKANLFNVAITIPNE